MNAEAEHGVPAPRGRWEFNEAVAAKFDEHVRKSVPGYEEIQFLAASLADWFAPSNGIVCDWGCSTGQTLGLIHGQSVVTGGKSLTLRGFDASEAMLSRARDTRTVGINFECARLPGCIEADAMGFHFGIFLLTLQFLTPDDRKRALEAAFAKMLPGGALFVVEKVYGSTPFFHDITSQLYVEMKRDNGLTADEAEAKTRSLRGVMHPLTVAENERAFERAGFDRSELIYRRLAFAGWIVTK